MLVHSREAIDELLEAALDNNCPVDAVVAYEASETVEINPRETNLTPELQKSTFGFFTDWVINLSL